MSQKELLVAALPELTAIPVDQVQEPHNIPINTYWKEAEELLRACAADWPELEARGLAPEVKDDIKRRIDVLQWAQGEWENEWKGVMDSGKTWKIQMNDAYNLRKTLVDEFKYAFRGDDDLLKKIGRITEDTGHAAMITDLNVLSIMGRDHADLLALTNFDVTLLDQAEGSVSGLTSAWAEATNERRNTSSTLDVRNRAYTYLKVLVDAVYDCGRFVFRNDPRRVKKYRSDFVRTRNIRRSQASNADEEPPVDLDPTEPMEPPVEVPVGVPVETSQLRERLL